jgi:hypothetical protein
VFWNKDLAYNFGDWLDTTWVKSFTEWVYSKRSRTIKVRIDKYDVWSMDHTLSYIILPMLKHLKENKGSSPTVDDADVPDYLRSTVAPSSEGPYGIDDNFHKRWQWVLDEMIFAFEMKVDDTWEDKFYSVKEVQDRISNGFRLFGKYYESLWS